MHIVIRCLRRLDASERVITLDKRHALRLNERLIGILRAAVSSSQQRLSDCKQQVFAERQRAIRAVGAKEAMAAQIRQLQVSRRRRGH